MRINTADMRQLALMLPGAYSRNHTDGCHYIHAGCAIDRLCDEVDRLRAMSPVPGNDRSQFGCGVCGQEVNDCGQDSQGCSMEGLLET